MCVVRIAVCDDLPGYGDVLGEVIEKWAFRKSVNMELKKFVSGEELLADIENTGYFHMILMDISLEGGINGIKAATIIKEKYEDICLIFVTRHDNYYKEVLGLHPFQYLEKPVSRKMLTECLDQALENCRYLKEVFVFRYKGMTNSIKLHGILYFESDKRVVRVYMENGEKFVFYAKLDMVEKKIRRYNHLFLRIHKSYLVNVGQIFQYHSQYVIMRNKEKLPISTGQRETVMQYHIKSLERFC